jgi:hypothetical protein
MAGEGQQVLAQDENPAATGSGRQRGKLGRFGGFGPLPVEAAIR